MTFYIHDMGMQKYCGYDCENTFFFIGGAKYPELGRDVIIFLVRYLTGAKYPVTSDTKL